MKKQIAAAMALVMLTGCGSTTSKYVAQTDKGSVTGDEFIKKLDTPETEYKFLLNEIYKKKYPTTKEMKKQKEERMKAVKAQFKSESSMKKYLSLSGFSSLEDYGKQYVDYLKREKFIKDYVSKNFDKVFADYNKNGKPRKIYMITVPYTPKTSAKQKKKLAEVQKYIKKHGFVKAAKKYMNENEKYGSLGIIDKINTNYLDSYASGLSKATFKLKEGQSTKFMKGKGFYAATYDAESDTKKLKKEMKSLPDSSPLLTYKTSLEYEAFKALGIKYEHNAKKMKSYIDGQISSGNAAMQNSIGGAK